jgi:hypothetical protein
MKRSRGRQSAFSTLPRTRRDAIDAAASISQKPFQRSGSLLCEVDQPTAASTIPDLQFGQRSVQKMVWADIRALCANQRRPRDDAAAAAPPPNAASAEEVLERCAFLSEARGDSVSFSI